MIGTAPRSPTQEINSRELMFIFLKGRRQSRTLSGRARTIMKMPIKVAGMAMDNISWGFTSNPKLRNMMIWKSQVMPLIKVAISLRFTMRALPTIIPAI